MVGVRYFCDVCGYDDEWLDLFVCAGECFDECCDTCLTDVGDKRYCKNCIKKLPGAALIGSPLLDPKPIVDFVFPPVDEEAVA